MKAFTPISVLRRHLAKLACLFLASLAITQPVAASSTTVVVSQVYGGGGNSGATYKNDFIELHNISGSAVAVAGWSVQYASATGTTWATTALTGSIPAGGYYLVQESAGAGGTTSLPAPDATGSINLSGTTGKVALVNTTTALASATPTGSSIVDLVAFGPTATGAEGGAPAPVLTNTTAALRANSGSTDTDNNAADFTAGAPAPRNSATTPFIPTSSATQVRVETTANGSGGVVAGQNVTTGNTLTVYSISRDASNAFIANAGATWSLTSVTGGVVAGDLVPSGDNKSAIFTTHAAGTAVIHAVIGGLTSIDSGTITAVATPTNPTAIATASATSLPPGQSTLLTVTVTPGINPSSSGISVSGDLSAIGGSAAQAFTAGANNTFTYNAAIPSNLSFGTKALSFSVADAQSRTASAALNLNVIGNLTIFHTNDTHARVTPHKWIVPQHSGNPVTQFEDVGGAAYMGAKMLSLVTGQPDALVLDGGDISEGNPIGDWNGPGFATGTYGDGTAVDYFKMLDTKLKAIPGRGGRGIDAMVVGNHDIRDISYINNMKAAAQANFPVISMNICQHGTQTPYFAPYVILTVNGNKIGVVGYTTESADSPETAVNTLIDVVPCDWSSTDSTKIHFANIVNDLRNNQGCTMVILLTHMGHSGLCTVTGANPTPILVDNSVAKVPEIVVSGHWHTFAETVWQPSVLNYKTIFTEAASFEHYIGELRVNSAGQYLSNTTYPLRVSDITPDADIAAYIAQRKTDYAATNPTYGVDQIVGYSSSNLLLDNYMKWWSADEYPWSGNNTAGNWICDAMQWKAAALFGHCDLSIESGGGVRSDIPAGPVKYTQIYETFPWPDDTIYLVKMTGQQIWNYHQQHGCDAAMSSGWHVTAFDGNPTAITYNGQPINLAQQYDVAINNYMYLHDSVPFTDPSPQFAVPGYPLGYLARTALVEFTGTFTQANPYDAGAERYTLNTEFSGGYRAVVMMMNDADTRTTFDDSFIRLLSANPETLQHRGTKQVPTDLVNADGSVVATNRLSEIELYRSYLGFKPGALKPGDIIETWGKGSFFGGDPEFVDQEGIQSDGVEFRIVGHDDSLAKPTFMPSIASFWNDIYKNHYVKFLAKKTGANSVADQTGQTIAIMDVTGFAAKTLPGNTGDLLLLTGVPTSESFALRFRSDSAVLASTAGITAFPASSTLSSHVDPVAAGTTSASLALTATASISSGNTFSLSPVADAQVSSGNPGMNYGTTTNMFVQSSSTSTFGNERAWLKFDLSTLPAGSTITSASLQLWCFAAAGAALPAEIHAVNSDTWTETGLNFGNQPALGAVLATQTLAPGAVNLWYNWDVTSFVQGEYGGDKQVSLVAKAVTEDSADATAPAYRFDAKEFGSNAPVLQVTTQASGTPVTIAQVQFFYRYSSDNATWGTWTAAATDTTAPYGTTFTFPNGFGYYEFYCLATDSLGGVESAPAAAQTATHYTAAPAYSTAAVAILSGLAPTYDGASHAATLTTFPPSLSATFTYNGSAIAPVNVGAYAVVATITQAGYTGSASDTLVIGQANQTISFGALPAQTVGAPPMNLAATANSGLSVSFVSDNPAVATISGSTLTIVGAGTATITASQAGNGNYLAAVPVAQSLTVNAAAGSTNGSDVPAMPVWALAALVALLLAAGSRFLTRGRKTVS